MTREVIAYIRSVRDLNELDQIYGALKEAYQALERDRQLEAAADFSIGDTVKFRTKRGETIVGTLIKKNTKTMKVKVAGGAQWAVSASLLSHV